MRVFLSIAFIAVFTPAISGEALRGGLRGDISVIKEPLWLVESGDYQSVSEADAEKAAKNEAASYFSFMIYGADFYYGIENKARGKKAVFEVTPKDGAQPFMNKIVVTDRKSDANFYRFYIDYEMNQAEIGRRTAHRSDRQRVASATGMCPLAENAENALRAAMQSAVRSVVSAMEKERPSAVSGRIALVDFPIVSVIGGEWVVKAKFFIDLTDVLHYALY